MEKSQLIYSFNQEEKTAYIVGNNNANGKISIPQSIISENQKFDVVSINEGSFKNSLISMIRFPYDSKVTTIEKNAFSGSKIECLFISSSIVELKKGWCICTSKLTNITIMPSNHQY